MTDFHVIIPARYGSTRLPGKPLLDIGGEPMIAHVYRRAAECGAASVVVATDDARIVKAAEAAGARVCLTRPDHPSGTDRLAEVVEQLALDDDAIVVNLQGDEPLMPPVLLQQVANDLAAHPDAAISTLCAPLEDVAQVSDPNVVKVVCNQAGYALYFSRASIPWQRDAMASGDIAAIALEGYRRHLGIYAYRAGFLHRYSQWPAAPIEQAEALEQLRALWHGERIHVVEAATSPPAGVDTEQDLERVRTLLTG
jgi:3-deoxy-manno-octulosonate cytidylyltransferase (CMP-KDO synthetase)